MSYLVHMAKFKPTLTPKDIMEEMVGTPGKPPKAVRAKFKKKAIPVPVEEPAAEEPAAEAPAAEAPAAEEMEISQEKMLADLINAHDEVLKKLATIGQMMSDSGMTKKLTNGKRKPAARKPAARKPAARKPAARKPAARRVSSSKSRSPGQPAKKR